MPSTRFFLHEAVATVTGRAMSAVGSHEMRISWEAGGVGGEGRIRTYGPVYPDSSHKGGCYDYSRSRTSPISHYAVTGKGPTRINPCSESVGPSPFSTLRPHRNLMTMHGGGVRNNYGTGDHCR